MAPSLMTLLGHPNEDEDRPKLAPDIEQIRLRDSYEQFITKHEFAPGMIVRQKPQVLCYSEFGDNDLAIVIEILKEPRFDLNGSAGSPYWNRPLDLVIASIEEGRQFSVYHVDSRGFEPVDDETKNA